MVEQAEGKQRGQGAEGTTIGEVGGGFEAQGRGFKQAHGGGDALEFAGGGDAHGGGAVRHGALAGPAGCREGGRAGGFYEWLAGGGIVGGAGFF